MVGEACVAVGKTGAGVAAEAVWVSCDGGISFVGLLPPPGTLHARAAIKTVRNAVKTRVRFIIEKGKNRRCYGVAVTVGWGTTVDPTGTGVASMNVTCLRPIESRNRCR